MWAVNKNKRPAWRTELSFLLLCRCCSLTPQLPLTLTGNSESKLAQSLMTTQVSFPNNAQLSCSVCSKCTFFGGVFFFGHLWLHLWLWCNEEMCVQVRTCLSPLTLVFAAHQHTEKINTYAIKEALQRPRSIDREEGFTWRHTLHPPSRFRGFRSTITSSQSLKFDSMSHCIYCSCGSTV